MENSDNQNQEIIFSENIGQVLTDVLKRYKLEETDDEVFKKLGSDQLFLGEIVKDLIRELVFGKIQEKDLPALLQQKLSISKEDAEKLSIEIKTKIIPLSRKISTEESEEREKDIQETIVADEKKDSLPITEKKSPEGLYHVKRIPTTTDSVKIKSSVLKRNSTKPIEKSIGPRKADAYKEPIE